MKTINDGGFYIDKDDEMDSYTLYMKTHGNTYGLIKLSKEYKSWIALPAFGLVSADLQKDIMDFVYTTDSNHWFDEPEKKYNIIVGEDTNAPIYAAYKKIMANEYIVCSHVYKDELRNTDELQFTEKDIEELKDCLPDYLSKIIDLGRVEVKG